MRIYLSFAVLLIYISAGIFAAHPAVAGTAERISVSTTGVQGDNDSGIHGMSVSADGRYAAFDSDADNLVSGDTNGCKDIFVSDRVNHITQIISVSTAGVQGTADSCHPSISSDGRYVTFDSYADNLVSGDTNVYQDVFVRDRVTGITERISISTAAAQGNNFSQYPSISGDGRYVAFESFASNLVSGDTNAYTDIFVRDRTTGVTQRISISTAGVQGNQWSDAPSISSDGRYVSFQSWASNLISTDTNGCQDVFVYDRSTGVTERISLSTAGVEGHGGSPSISSDGRYVAFDSDAANLVVGDTNVCKDVYLRDRTSGITERISVSSSGIQGSGFYGSGSPSISSDGRYVAFQSYADDLVPGDLVSTRDIFVHDRENDVTERISASAEWDDDSCSPSISANGTYIAFSSSADNLVTGDTNIKYDAFVQVPELIFGSLVTISTVEGQRMWIRYPDYAGTYWYGSRQFALSPGQSYLVQGQTSTNWDSADLSVAANGTVSVVNWAGNLHQFGVGGERLVVYDPTLTGPPVFVTAITPGSAGNAGSVSITNLAGFGFETGATVKLTKTGEVDITAANVVVESSTKITCTFNLAGAKTGLWNVYVQNTNGSFGQFANGFTVLYTEGDTLLTDNFNITGSTTSNLNTDISIRQTGAFAPCNLTTTTPAYASISTDGKLNHSSLTTTAYNKDFANWSIVGNKTHYSFKLNGLVGYTTVYISAPGNVFYNGGPGFAIEMRDDGLVYLDTFNAAHQNNGINFNAGTGWHKWDIFVTQKSGYKDLSVNLDNIEVLTRQCPDPWWTGGALSFNSAGMQVDDVVITGSRASAPTITSITPASGPNTGSVSITNLAGTGFVTGAAVKLTKSGQSDIIATSVSIVSSSKITCVFNLTSKTLGTWNVVVTNADAQSATLTNGFEITSISLPTITSITPASGLNTGSVNITNLAGTGFITGATVKLTKSGQSDIIATSVSVVSSSKITCVFNLTTKALGTWNVVVTNSDAQSATLTNGFEITAPAPTVTSITPATAANTAPVNITNLAGTGFITGAVVKLTKSGQSDIIATSVSIVSSLKITCVFDITNKALGTWNVVVTNSDSQSATLTNGFEITGAAPTTIATAKSLTIGSNAYLKDAYVSAKIYNPDGSYYGFAVEESDRFIGIRVITSTVMEPGTKADIYGAIYRENGEYVIDSRNGTVIYTGTSTPIAPYSVATIDTGGGLKSNQGAVLDNATKTPKTASTALNTVGMYMRIRGIVTAVGADYFYVNDGYGVTELLDGSGYTGMKCGKANLASLPAAGDHVEVTGVVGVKLIGGYNTRYLWTTTLTPATISTYAFYVHSGLTDFRNMISLPAQPVYPDPAILFTGIDINNNLQTYIGGTSAKTYTTATASTFGGINYSYGYSFDSSQNNPYAFSYLGYNDPTPLDRWISVPNGVSGGSVLLGVPYNHAVKWNDWHATDLTALKTVGDADTATWMDTSGDWYLNGIASLLLPGDTLYQNYGYKIKVNKKLVIIAPSNSTLNKTVSGNVLLEDLSNDAIAQIGQIPIIIGTDNSTTNIFRAVVPTQITPNSGNFSIDVNSGIYNISLKATHWLRKLATDFNVDSITNLGSYNLINGDVIDNNEVDFDDINAVRSAYGSFPGDGNWNERADVDGSGEVDFTDINIVRSNYGEIGE